MKKHTKVLSFVVLVALMLCMFGVTAFADAEEVAEEAFQSNMYATFWALVPPIIAIVLALITKEVYSSLFVGIVAGALFYSNFNLRTAYDTMFNEGFISKLSDSWNVGILVFLVVLGAIVVLMNRAGGSAAYGEWAGRKITSRKGALFATFGLGALIFVDDYFNCLTVGSVMRPITDKHKISRAKLAYLIDATAAPVCMIAPVSSWAAAVVGVVDGYDGFQLFIDAIPYNLYSILTIVMIIMITAFGIEYGPMRKHEMNALKGDIYTTPDRPYANAAEEKVSSKGKVIDLILPVLFLIFCCIAGMMYTGGILDGESFVDSFANCDASLGLSMGSVFALIFIIIYYLARRVLTFNECMSALPEGFKAMVPAILILTFAWTLSAMTGLLGGAEFVSGVFEAGAKSFFNWMPVIVFLVALGLAFATGTSWGTFGILLPIIVNVGGLSGSLLIGSVAACLAGAVCGDHISPISDTTIMASTGAQSNHINHVSTQLPYALTVAAVCCVGYILTGFIQNPWIVLPISAAILVAVLLVIKYVVSKKEA